MQFVRYKRRTQGRDRARLAVRTANGLRDLEASYERFVAAGMPPVKGLRGALKSGSLRCLLAVPGTDGLFAALRKSDADGVLVDEGRSIHLCAPLHDPRRFIGVGLNYRDHAREIGQSLPAYPPLFAKWTNAINGPYDPITLPANTQALDYEVELGIVIGSRATRVPVADALQYVFGYTIINDVSARDLQFQTSQWLAGKIGDGFAPLGPAITERADIASVHDLTLQTWVNGTLRQNGNTQNMVFDPAALVSYLSHLITLEPGDIIASGTPAGVGMSQNPPRYLKPGDVVRMSIAGLGTIENRVCAA
ncbi:MAG TPA: fumarylacetoacetate hydrolase family protein [Acidiferrobacter sp.]|nr:fumarylacetoacetate hydrolase family protein [Acidiferrobacter sp.]